MNAASLHDIADHFELVFTEMKVMSKAERIVELAGAQWVGVQRARQEDGGSFVMFRDPVSGSTLALPDEGISVSAVQDRMRESRARFGAAGVKA